MRAPKSGSSRRSRPPRARRWRFLPLCSERPFIAALAAITALAVGVVLALAKFLGPLLAGIAGLVIFAAIAGGLAWYGAQRVKQVL